MTKLLPIVVLLTTCAWNTNALAKLDALAQKGKRVIERSECTRCHDVTHVGGSDGVANAEREMHCVDCHTWILGTKGDDAAIARQRADFPDWDRFLENIVHLKAVPDLGTLTRRVRPAFVRGFLDGPYDLRPHLEASMIPIKLTAAQKDALVHYLKALNGDAVAFNEAPSKPPAARQIAAGRTLFVAKGCPSCHTRGNERFNPAFDRAYFKAMRAVAQLAPNLRYVPDRMPRSVLVRFIVDPKAVDPETTMPKQPVSPAEAERIADYLLHGAQIYTDASRPDPTPEIKLLSREVRWDAVFEDVFGKICVHCHMNPESNNGDGGAGNTGGLGYAGVKLEFETYEGLKRGLVRDGKRVDVLKPEGPGKASVLVESLLRRHREGARDFREPYADALEMGTASSAERPGMPMGLPPLSVRQIQLIKTWIAQGAKGPAAP